MKCKLLLLTLLVIVGCYDDETTDSNAQEVEEKELDYDVTSSYQIEWSKIFEISDSPYSLYFYSETCGHCKIIKQEILSYFLLEKEEMYFVNVTGIKDIYKSNDGSLIGVDKIEDFYIIGTPFLINIENSAVSNWYAGVDSIRMYIENATI